MMKPAPITALGGPTRALMPQKRSMPQRIMGGAPRRPNPMIATADRTLSSANERLEGMPGRVARAMPGSSMQPSTTYARGGKTAFAKGGMSRMHFKRAAEIMRRHGDAGRAAGAKDPVSRKVAEDMPDWFQESNERFDRKRFMDAAGFGDAPPVKKAKGGKVKGRAKASLSAAKEAAAYAKGGKVEYAKGGRATGLKQFVVKYRGTEEGSPTFEWRTRAHDREHAIDKFYEGSTTEEGWEALSADRVRDHRGKVQR